MAELETDIRGVDRLKTIWCMIRGKRLVIHFNNQVMVDAITRAMRNQSNDGKSE